jgi:hypothetical protein
MIPGVAERDLPPPEERVSLADAGDLFDPPRSKKAVEQLVHRGSLDFAREPGEEGQRARRVVTTRAWLEAYVEASAGKARLREEYEVLSRLAQMDVVPEPKPDSEPLLEIIRTQGGEIAVLKARLAQLEEQLRRGNPGSGG